MKKFVAHIFASEKRDQWQKYLRFIRRKLEGVPYRARVLAPAGKWPSSEPRLAHLGLCGMRPLTQVRKQLSKGRPKAARQRRAGRVPQERRKASRCGELPATPPDTAANRREDAGGASARARAVLLLQPFRKSTCWRPLTHPRLSRLIDRSATTWTVPCTGMCLLPSSRTPPLPSSACLAVAS